MSDENGENNSDNRACSKDSVWFTDGMSTRSRTRKKASVTEVPSVKMPIAAPSAGVRRSSPRRRSSSSTTMTETAEAEDRRKQSRTRHGSRATAQRVEAAADAASDIEGNLGVDTTERRPEQPTVPWFEIFTKGNEQYNRYMATEWGFEKRGDVALFENVSLESAQSGLSWLTVLRKRDAYRRTFHGFDIDKVAAMTDDDVQAILDQETEDATQMIVRHRGKVQAVINNARKIQELRRQNPDDSDPFDTLLWSFVDDRPILYRWNGDLQDANTKTKESIAMSKELKKRGFKFVGPTTCYAMMQAVGMVIEHPVDSPEWVAAVERLKRRKGGYQKVS